MIREFTPWVMPIVSSDVTRGLHPDGPSEAGGMGAAALAAPQHSCPSALGKTWRGLGRASAATWKLRHGFSMLGAC